MRVILLGPPGAGKGTQAARLAAKLGVPQVATGDILRMARASDSALGRKVAGYMDRGDLVPDELVNEVALDRLRQKDAARGFVLDGYPRTIDQAKTLQSFLDDKGTKLDAVIKFMVTKDEIVKRLSGRRVCPKCNTVYHMIADPPENDEICDFDGTPLVQREDDKEEAVARRLVEYGAQTRPLYDLYENEAPFIEIDAMGSSDEVFDRLTKALGTLT